MYQEKTKKRIKLIFIFISIFLLTLIVYIDCKGNNSKSSVYVKDQLINLFKSNDAEYLFLPSGVEESDINWSMEAAYKNPVVMHSSNIASVFLTTRSGSMDKIYNDSSYSETGKITVLNENGSKDYSGALKSIKGRGNYSWTNWDKKSFTISVGGSDSLLGLESGGKYALVANASDATLIRNEIARQLEARLGMEYTFLGRFIDLYINGDYMGNYYLCPTLCIDEGRINVTDLEQQMDRMYSKTDYTGYAVYETPDMKGWNLPDEPKDITGGYLLEREFIERYELEYSSMGSGLETDNGECFVVKSPAFCSMNQINYLYSLMNEVEKTIYSPDGINSDTGKALEDYIDIESFAKWYLAGEITKNYDAGISSTFIYKDSDLIDGRLKMASGWDYDMSLGNYLDWMEYYYQDPTGLTLNHSTGSASMWGISLYDNDLYRRFVVDIFYEKALPYLDELLSVDIDDYQKYLADSTSMDAIRWKDMYIQNGYTVGDTQYYEELKNFIRIRRDYLSACWSK